MRFAWTVGGVTVVIVSFLRAPYRTPRPAQKKPKLKRDQCRREMRLLFVIVIAGLLFAAFLVGGLYLLNNPMGK